MFSVVQCHSSYLPAFVCSVWYQYVGLITDETVDQHTAHRLIIITQLTLCWSTINCIFWLFATTWLLRLAQLLIDYHRGFFKCIYSVHKCLVTNCVLLTYLLINQCHSFIYLFLNRFVTFVMSPCVLCVDNGF